MLMDQPRPMPEWLAPLLVASLAVPTFVAFWLGGRPALGAVWASLNIAFALVLAVGGRSDTIKLLRGSEDDERAMALELRAMSLTLTVVVLALAGLFLASGIRGESGLVYAVLLLVTEATHIASLAILNRRS